MENLTDYKSKKPEPNGITTINHNVRCRMQLDCNEYVLIEYIVKIRERYILYDYGLCYLATGFVPEQQEMLLRRLFNKEFIAYINHPNGQKDIKPTGKWDELFFDQIERQFDRFWTEDINGKSRTAWNGSKPEAYKIFRNLVPQYGFDKLMQQRKSYFRFLELQKSVRGFDRQRMMATVFLNMQKERYNEDWAGQVEELEKLRKEKEGVRERIEQAPVTTKDKNDLFID
jgi:hypothetical protein